MPNKSGSSSSNNNDQLFPPLNYSRSYFTQWLLKDSEEFGWKEQTLTKQSSRPPTSSPGHTKRNNMELIQLLAINALEFTAPVYSFLNKDCNKPGSTTTNTSGGSHSLDAASSSNTTEVSKELSLNREFIQLSGHPGSFAPAGPTTIWKKMPNDSSNEAVIYERLRDKYPTDPLLKLIPNYISRTEWNGSVFIELEDLATRFNQKKLNIMDLKLGVRTFLESEVTNTKPRLDLYEKMIKLDVSSPTEEEKLTKSVTKLRYMQFREELSSSNKFGFRIEGVKLSDSLKNEIVKELNLQTVKDELEIVKVFKLFLDKIDVKMFLVKLNELRLGLEKSNFFMSHELIGCSLLLIHDECKLGAWIIDFAKTFEYKLINHRIGWKMGNREDGVLNGIDNIIRLIELI